MIHVRCTAPVMLPAGLKLHKLAAELADDRRQALKQIAPGVHQIVKPTQFVAGDQLEIEGEILGAARGHMVTRAGDEEITLGEHYRRVEEGMPASAKAAAPREDKGRKKFI